MSNIATIIWITGASSGIGYSLTSKLLQQKNIVIATARQIDKLKSLQQQYPNSLHVYPLDVTNSIAVDNFCKLIQEKFTYIDTMILNAGVCRYIDLPNFDIELMQQNMNVNFWGLVYCIKHGLPLLTKSRKPYIVGMTSATSIIGLPRAEGYGSSKAAARSLLQSLQADLYAQHIDVSIITPGFVKTELTYKNDFPMPTIMSVDTATDIILRGLHGRKPEIKFPITLILALHILRILPDKLRIYLTSRMARK